HVLAEAHTHTGSGATFFRYRLQCQPGGSNMARSCVCNGSQDAGHPRHARGASRLFGPAGGRAHLRR
ncbi:unnamed protein product, partial [Ectocarpus fasciculatus]